MNKLLKFFCCVLIIFYLVAENPTQESFIVPPRQKKESHNKILERNAHLLMNNTKKMAHFTTFSSSGLEQLLEYGNQLVTEKKNSFFSKATDVQLQEFATLSEELSRTIENCQRSLHQGLNKITNLTNSVITK